jgi:hypothetical protein
MTALEFGFKIANYMSTVSKRSLQGHWTRSPVHRQTLAQAICYRPHEFAAGFNYLKSSGHVKRVPGSKTTYFLTQSGIDFVDNPPPKPATKPYYEAFTAKPAPKTSKNRVVPKAADAPLHP